MVKRLISFFAVCVILFGVLAGSASAITDTRDGVAVLVAAFEDTKGNFLGMVSSGTCFFVGEDGKDPQNLVTNYHVVESFFDLGKGELVNVSMLDLYRDWEYLMTDDQKAEFESTLVTGRCKMYIYFDSMDKKDRIEAYHVDSDEVKDLSILKISKPTDRRRSLPLLAPTQEMIGQNNIQAVGFPSIADNDYSASVTEWGSNDVTVTSGSISRLLTQSGTGTELIQIDCDINHGNSGGPLTNDAGAVLGVNTMSVSDQGEGQVNYAVNISEVITILEKNNVPYTPFASGQSKTDKNTNSSAAAPAKPATAQTPAQSGDSGNTIMWIIIAVAAVAVIGGVVAVIVAVSKKSSEKVKAAQESARKSQAEAQAANVKTPIVRSLAVQHRGSKVELAGSNQIIIGRNKTDCKIVFSESTPGVSNRHCSVAFDPATNDFVLTDLKSTYGTFLQNGQRLTPLVQYRLRSGDRFYVGEPSNLIAVELG